MSREPDFPPPWIRIRQEPLLDMAANTKFPNALRVYYFALANVKANGHATFKQGEVATLLGTPDDEAGWIRANYRTVWAAIRQAVENGWLAEESRALCMVLPRHHVRGGEGSEHTPCPRHRKRHRKTLRAVP